MAVHVTNVLGQSVQKGVDANMEVKVIAESVKEQRTGIEIKLGKQLAEQTNDPAGYLLLLQESGIPLEPAHYNIFLNIVASYKGKKPGTPFLSYYPLRHVSLFL